ncbi:aminotransferase class III-fold pyridoxal phosphate-dependent enzyme [Starkeya koreensis]|uniref:Aminotransferase class III-fold pyridoxal phosphate-dependent enzyme n=1 Tax=Ancylobacter koreensis TaxID=266121 RepID=A0ABT0DKC9_9HYPH|nr:aminotransferase class III-fold pyridoxal phosphate-dependent enzyme [Ancylobacter koreensis]MCK0207742.1 aminotransferase class III-fold pyridoxal phosphate-dependent enzyme [Ancylobacter koreensis]
MSMVNAFDPDAAAALPEAEKELIRRREKLLGPAYRLFYQQPVHIVRGEGVWLYDPQGNAYLDVYNNVASVGHCHPKVVQALARQASTLNTHTRYLHETILDYAERLLAKVPAELGHIMFTCTGSEANDLALRITRAYTGRQGMIVTRLAYHGLTSAVSELSPSLGDFVKPGPHVRFVAPPDGYRGEADVGAAFAAGVRAAIDDMRAQGIEPAALLVDTIFSSDGVFADPPGFLKEAVAAIREAGGLFIADEVQPGFGRVGPQFWGFTRHGLVPDMVTVGKPMGNGHPMAGVMMKPHLVEEFGRKARYFNTFGGNPVACAVGLAVLDVMEGEGLPERAREVGDYMRAGLRDLAGRCEAIGDVRGAGQFTGLELVEDRATKAPAAGLTTRIVNGLRERRVLISATGPGANILKIRPPLAFAREHADIFLDRFADALKANA